jgi:hypothetical protein
MLSSLVQLLFCSCLSSPFLLNYLFSFCLLLLCFDMSKQDLLVEYRVNRKVLFAVYEHTHSGIFSSMVDYFQFCLSPLLSLYLIPSHLLLPL